MGEIAGLFDRCFRLLMKVGDLVTFPNSVSAPQTGIVLQTEQNDWRGRVERTRVKVFWFEDAEVSWEPVKWMEVINPS